MTETPADSVTDPGVPADPTGVVFVLVVTYLAPLSSVDAALPAHRRFLDENFAAGTFLASGPRDPRTGGVILARVSDRDHLDRVIGSDPFVRQGLAAYEVHAFRPNRGPFARLLGSGSGGTGWSTSRP